MKLASNRRGKLLVLGSLGLLLAGGWWLRIPRHEGRSMAYWFKEYQRTNGDKGVPGGQEVQQAIQALGTSAVPYLLQHAFPDDWDVRLWAWAVVRVPRLAKTVPLRFRPDLIERDLDRGEAYLTATGWLLHLHPPASLLLSTLTNRLNDRHPAARQNALLMLGCLDATVIPLLRPALKDPDQNIRMMALAALAELGTNATEAVPDLIRVLDDPLVHNTVPIQTLHRIGAPARAALPRLRELWKAETNFHALAAILQIGGEAWARDAFRQSLQRQADPVLRLGALRCLEDNYLQWSLDQPPTIADGNFLRPELQQALEDDDVAVRSAALGGIWALKLDSVVPKTWLEDKLRQPLPPLNNSDAAWNEWHERMCASVLLLRRDPANALALSFLTDRFNDFLGHTAVVVLARIENPSPEIQAVLRRAAAHYDPDIRRLAQEAVSRFR